MDSAFLYFRKAYALLKDSNHPENYEGPYLFSDPDGNTPESASRPFPYRLTEHVAIRNLTSASGRDLRTSPDAELTARVQVNEAEGN